VVNLPQMETYKLPWKISWSQKSSWSWRMEISLKTWIRASHNADSKHLRPLICAKEDGGFHKRVKRKHDPVKIVVPCIVVEVEFPIPPDRCMQLSPYIG
ncbi:hypothetical protein HID58_025072, partial [Brassica napus]